MTDKKPNVHLSVQEHYGAIAQTFDASAQASCCGDDCGCDSDRVVSLYEEAILSDLPFDVTGLSLGCGDPVTIAGLKAGETVLDLGSGGGLDCFMATKQVGENGHVIGVDMTPEMLEKANANKTRLGLENVEFRKGYIEELPVDDNSVDIIMSNCVINLSPDKSAVFADSLRVLKAGGRLSVSDIVTEGEFTEDARADMSRWSGCVTGAIDVNVYTGLMEEAGFTNITVVDKINVGDDPQYTIKQGEKAHIYSARITAYKPE